MALRHAAIGDVRGDGAFWVVEFAQASWPETLRVLTALVDAALARGVSFAVRGDLILLAPPLVITDGELDRGAVGARIAAHRMPGPSRIA